MTEQEKQPIVIDVGMSFRADDPYEYTERVIDVYNALLPPKNRLTKTEKRVCAVLMCLRGHSSDPYSEQHLQKYEEIFGRPRTVRDMYRYTKVIVDKGWAELPDTRHYELLHVFPDWSELLEEKIKFNLKFELEFN
jgi:hypothetical protein